MAILSLSCSGPASGPLHKSSATSEAEPRLFVDRAADLGIDFQHIADEPGSYFLPEIMGSGCALFDFDRDNDLDVLLMNLGTGYATGSKTFEVTHRLYEQVERRRFVDVSERAGFVSRGLGMGVAIGDANNDGWPDVYFTSHGPDQLFLNRGKGRFEDVTESAGIDNRLWGTSACFVDFDRDGWLDLFVTNYLDYHDRHCTRVGGGDRDFCSPHLFTGTSSKLFRNMTGEMLDFTSSSKGPDSEKTEATSGSPAPFIRFRDVSLESRIASQRGPALGVAAADFSGDDWPDLYVANDQAANCLWINQRDGTFVDEAVARGCAYDAQGNAQASMGVAMGDPDQDFDLDLYLTHLDGERNTLYIHGAGGLFDDGTIPRGLGEVSLPFTGFGTAFLDLDLDGDEDLITVNGRVKRGSPKHPATAGDFWAPYRQRGQILLNAGAGTFTESLPIGDGLTSSESMSRGLAVGDLDSDGDLDVVVNRIGAPAAVFMNELQRKNAHWVAVRALDPKLGDRDVYGAVISVISGKQRWIRIVQPGTSYASSHAPIAHFGLGSLDHIDRIEIRWPDGGSNEFPSSGVDRQYVLRR